MQRLFLLHLLLIITLLFNKAVYGETTQPLPSPLSLEQALSYATESNTPSIIRLSAERDISAANLQSLSADDSLSLSLNGRLRWAEPINTTSDSIVDDHRLSLNLRKRLYDFSGSEYELKGASSTIQSNEMSIEQERANRRLIIMKHFFEVILSDLQYDRDNEELAIVFIRYNRLKDRHGLGQVSDIDLYDHESRLQKALLKRSKSESKQRFTRAKLASVLNRPGDLPATLITPEFSDLDKKVPEFEAARDLMFKHNYSLKALEQKIEAVSSNLAATNRIGYPDVIGEVEVADYTRHLGSADRWRIGVTVSVPLMDGGKQQAKTVKATAELAKVKADRDLVRQSLEQELLETWLSISQYKQIQSDAFASRDFQELYLDRSRANYEMEFKADLGDAMVKFSEVQLQEKRVEFEAALAWEKLSVLTGGQIH